MLKQSTKGCYKEKFGTDKSLSEAFLRHIPARQGSSADVRVFCTLEQFLSA